MKRAKLAATRSGFCSTEAAVRGGQLASRTDADAWHAMCRAEACGCEHHIPTTATPTEGATPMPEPQTSTNHTRPGGASRAAAKQRAKVDENKARVDAINANSSPAPPKEEPKEEPKADAPKADAAEPTVVFCVDGKPVGESQNKLSSISRVTATAEAPRWPAPQFRAWLGEQGIAEPNHTEWTATLPNGRVVSAVSAAKAAELRKAKAPAKQTAATTTTERVKAEKAAAATARAAAKPGKKTAPAKKAATAKKAPAKRAAASAAKKSAEKSTAKETATTKAKAIDTEVEPILKESQKRAS